MGKIVRYEFIGGISGALLFFILCMTGILIPFAVIYLVSRIVGIEEEVENPTEFLEEFRSGRLGRKPKV
jgi:hypothetical protein